MGVGAVFMVNYIFSQVSETVGETLKDETVSLPVLDENNQIAKDKSISVVLSAEIVKKLEAKIPISEKLEVLTLLAKTLSKEDYEVLLSYAVGGVNDKKFNSAYALMREKLGPEEKAIIKGYYAKYIHLLDE